MDPIMTRIKRVTEELHSIERDLQRLSQDTNAAQHIGIIDESESVALLGSFKVAVDNMRRFLWAYIEATSGSNVSMNEALQTARLVRVTELLRVLHENEGPTTGGARGISDIVDAVLKPRDSQSG
ncbi:MAG TPA: hypothetical protein VLA96_05650 [Terriglobales bacterium]|nr:hypothetical protein [Terriglobales bacterium]